MKQSSSEAVSSSSSPTPSLPDQSLPATSASVSENHHHHNNSKPLASISVADDLAGVGSRDGNGGAQETVTVDRRGEYSAVCRWTVHNFPRIKARALWSKYFEVGGYDCRLLVYPKGDSQALPGYISIYLQIMDPRGSSSSKWDCFASYRLAIVNLTDDSKTIHRDSWHRFSSKKKSHDWSTETAESTRDGSRNAFRKRALPDYSSTFIFGDVFRRKVFFNYEKRLRLRSPPEKVFEYFASFRTPKGELLMRPADLMRAVVPVFPPSESHLVRDGYLTGERSPGELRCDPSEFFMLFDMNNDGLISFKEYIFFVTLLSIPESCFSIAFKMFDVDNNGEIDKEEFKKVMALMRANNRQGSVHRDGLRVGLKVTGSVENGGLVEYFFGKDGKACLQHDKFVQFMRNLQDEVCGISLTDNVVEIIFHVFDANRDGNLSSDEFIRVLLKREKDIARPVESGIVGLLSCCWNCSNNSSIGRVIS